MTDQRATPADPAPSPNAAPTPDTPPAPQAPAKNSPFRFIWPAIIACMVLVGVALIVYAWRLPPFFQTIQRTDNAYVRGQITIIAPQTSGYVTHVAVQDYQAVKAGQLLATIDDRIYKQRVEQAKAALHAAEGVLANSTQTQQSAQGSVLQTQASVQGALAQLAKARADFERIEQLSQNGWATRAQLDAARAAMLAADANVAQSRATVGVAQTGVTSAVVSRQALEAQVESARAQLALAQIDLDNTRITAPADGQLGEVNVRLGQQVTTGTQLMALVPHQLWVIANLKETQMKDIRIGQPADIAVDALGSLRFTGKVSEISPATGSEFSVIRTDNASGNFTKVPQRVSVKILLDKGQPSLSRLRPGLSVVASINTKG